MFTNSAGLFSTQKRTDTIDLEQKSRRLKFNIAGISEFHRLSLTLGCLTSQKAYVR
jgi:hypothetical protein